MQTGGDVDASIAELRLPLADLMKHDETTDRPCEICSSRPAKLMIVRRRQEDMCRTYVCHECAQEQSRLYTKASVDLQRMVVQLDGMPDASRATRNFGCRLCGATLADVVADGRPGCCLCYSCYAEDMEQAISHAQGSTRHIGKVSAR